MSRIKQAKSEQAEGDKIAHIKRCFTLIELLVVISIIALLMAILIPFLRKAKGQAKAVYCKNNMRQIGIAANLYADVWDSYIPRGEPEGETKQTWFVLFMPYLSEEPRKIGGQYDYRSVKIYRCPSYPDKEQTVCYVSNAWDPANTGSGKAQIQEPTKLNIYCRLASTIYLAENENGHWREIITEQYSDGWDYCDVYKTEHLPRATEAQHEEEKSEWTLGNSDPDGPRVARNRHGRGCNVLFADWHVESMAREKLAGWEKTGERNRRAINLWRFKRK